MSLSLWKAFPYSALAALAMIAGAAADEPCPFPGQTRMLVAELFFGRGAVSDAAWRRFVLREVSPRFPDGSTVLDARGEWRDPLSGHVARERSKVLIIAAPQSPQTLDRVASLAAAYRSEFHQRSVGIVTSTECAAF
jgi:hypothetical protein